MCTAIVPSISCSTTHGDNLVPTSCKSSPSTQLQECVALSCDEITLADACPIRFWSPSHVVVSMS